MGQCIACIDKVGEKNRPKKQIGWTPLANAIEKADPNGQNSFLKKMRGLSMNGRTLTDPQKIVTKRILKGKGVDTSDLGLETE